MATSSLSWFEPWGLWQFRQFSRTGACSHRKGPRFSVWHWRQSSFTQSALIILGVEPSWGLWQLAAVHQALADGVVRRAHPLRADGRVALEAGLRAPAPS